MADQPISEKVILSAQVPASQRDQLARLAAEHDRPLSYVVREALSDYLERSVFSASGTSSTSAGVSSSSAASGEVSATRGEGADAA
jgi:predicted transcriptional regulator